jgi:hypothetical protein
LKKFGQAYFFSIQTYTTVCYEHVIPTGFLTSIVSLIEALIGLLTFAIAMGFFRFVLVGQVHLYGFQKRLLLRFIKMERL